MAGWHGGIADSYRNSSDYLQLIGGQFACHPGKDPALITGPGPENNYVPYTVNILPSASDHPIVAGLTDFDLVTEQYWVLHDQYIDVLATTTQKVRPWDPWHREITSPAVWTREWGKGRIFVATPGHSLDVLRDTTRCTPSSSEGCCGPAAEDRHRRLRRDLGPVPGRRPPA